MTLHRDTALTLSPWLIPRVFCLWKLIMLHTTCRFRILKQQTLKYISVFSKLPLHVPFYNFRFPVVVAFRVSSLRDLLTAGCSPAVFHSQLLR